MTLSFFILVILATATASVIALASATIPSPIFINASSTSISSSKATTIRGTFRSTVTNPQFPLSYFRHARRGRNLRFSVPLPKTTSTRYSISLSIGVIEPSTYNCRVTNRRLFSVLVNNQRYVSDYNIAKRTGCLRPHTINIDNVHRNTNSDQSLIIQFKSTNVKFVTFVNFIYISFHELVEGCVPDVKTGKLSSDHSAHSVPGSYAPVINANNQEKVRVQIDGSNSHTHFFNPELDVIGRITSIKWEDLNTNQVISNKLKFQHDFRKGETKLKLTVRDNSCDQHSAITNINILPQLQNGMYCDYFSLKDSTTQNDIKFSQYLNKQPVEFAQSWFNLKPNFFNSPFSSRKFITRCHALIRFADSASNTIQADTQESGIVSIYDQNNKQILSGGNLPSTTYVRQGNQNTWNKFTILFARTNIVNSARLTINVNGKLPLRKNVAYNTKNIIPSISQVIPSKVINTDKEADIQLVGYGLYPPCKVLLDGKTVTTVYPGSTKSTQSELFIKLPKQSQEKNVQLSIVNAANKKSNSLTLTYKKSSVNQCNTPAFTDAKITYDKNKNDQNIEIDWIRQPTSVTLGPDNNLYIGTLNGSVAVLGYDPYTLKASSYCYSESLMDDKFKGAPRSVLGITFNPVHGDKIIPYVSTSTVNYWKASRIPVSNRDAWKNGAIERMKLTKDPSTFKIGKSSGICMVLDKQIITGLPVANGGSHSVNSIVFTDSGDMLVSVGGNTNMGLPGLVMGNLWESPLSAAIIRLPHSIITNPSALPYAVKYSGGNNAHESKFSPADNQLSIHATGVRNLFTMTVCQNGEVFGVDQGPGCPLGGAPSKCSDYSKDEYTRKGGLNLEEDWPSAFKGDEGSCSGTRREDKVIKIEKGAFYGHANINRGECQWIDPLTSKTLDGKSAPANYKKPITILEASVTSVVEYSSAGRFCNQLKNKLVLSTYRGISTYYMNKNGKSQHLINKNNGGTSFIEDSHGNLVFPRLTERFINVMVPQDNDNNIITLRLYGATPKRVKQSGNVSLWIGGTGFRNQLNQVVVSKVQVGNAPCRIINVQISMIHCKVPSRSQAGSKRPSLKVVTTSGKSLQINHAFGYINK